jgi:hypothetical protein
MLALSTAVVCRNVDPPQGASAEIEHLRSAAAPGAEPSKEGPRSCADVGAPSHPDPPSASDTAVTRGVEEKLQATSKGVAVPSPVTRYPYRTNVSLPSASLSVLRKLCR